MGIEWVLDWGDGGDGRGEGGWGVDCLVLSHLEFSFLSSIHSPQHVCSPPSQTVGIYITPPHFEFLQISRFRAKRLRKNACSSVSPKLY